MKVSEILRASTPSFSFEFFPPRSEKSAKELYKHIQNLIPLNPSFVSVTYGAGGGTRNLTHDLLVKISTSTDLTVVSHLTCVGHGEGEIQGILERYERAGIHNILALRGDPPAGSAQSDPYSGEFRYAADLVKYIKTKFPQMCVGVAGFPEGHPQTPNRLLEMDYLKRKVDAGADYIVTQLFFDNHDFFDFRRRCELHGINVPIIAGIMPVLSLSNIKRMAELAQGAHYPAPLLQALSRATSDKEVARIGIQWAGQQVNELLHNQVGGIHFYTLNKSTATAEIYSNLALKNYSQTSTNQVFGM